MRKKIILNLLSLIFLIVLPQNMHASEIVDDQSAQSIYDSSGLGDVEPYYTSEISSYMQNSSFMEAIFDYLKGEDITDVSIGEIIKEIAINSFHENIGSISLIMAFIVFLSLINMLTSSIGNSQSNQAAFYAIYLMLLIVLVTFVYQIIDSTNTTVAYLTEFMNVLMVPLLSLMAMSGAISSAAILSPMLLFYINFLTSIIKTVLIPLFMSAFAIGVINQAAFEVKLKSFEKLLKQAGYFIMGIIMLSFGAVSAVKGIAFSSLDGVMGKSVKYAVSNLIPVVGRFLSDSADTVASVSLIIKNGAGLVAYIILLFIVLTPIIKTGVIILLLKLSAALTEPISDERCTALIENAANTMMNILSCLLLCAVMFFIFIGIVCTMSNFSAMLR
jgi:stage III sporulation protein AE